MKKQIEKSIDIGLVLSGKEWLDQEDWLEELIRRLKNIQENMNLDIWKRYREAGKLLLEVSYKHSLEARTVRKKILDAMEMKTDAVLTTMRQLANKTDEEIVADRNQFRTLWNFAHKLPVSEDVKEYRKEKAAKQSKTECYCEQGNPSFSPSHCCELCQFFKKRRTVVMEDYKKKD